MKVTTGYLILMDGKKKEGISYKLKDSLSLVNNGRIVLTAKCKQVILDCNLKEIK